MEKQKGVQLVIILVLVATVFAMSVAYAINAYTETLTISGTATVKKAVWDIHLDDSSYSPTTSQTNAKAVVPASNPTFTATTMTFAVTLPTPGNFYEFTIPAVNAGTFNAILKSITITETGDDSTKDWVTTTVSVGGNDYTSTTTGLSIALNAANGNTPTTQSIKVKVLYNEQQTASNLPTADTTVNITIALDYEQTT